MVVALSACEGGHRRNAAAIRAGGVFTKLYTADKPPKSRSFTFRVMGDKL
jgi:hypothetical protein